MSITLPSLSAKKECCTFDGCYVTMFLKNLLSKSAGTKTNYNYTISEKAGDIKSNLASLGNSVINLGYFSTLEQILPGTAFRYVTINKNDKPVLLAYFQLHNISKQNFTQVKNEGVLKDIMRFFWGVNKTRVLISGNVLRCGETAFVYDKNELTHTQAVEGFLSAAEKIAEDEHLTAIVLRDVELTSECSEKGYSMPMEDIVMDMDINPSWLTLGDYINDLSRKYKTRAKKIIETATPLTKKLLSASQIEQYETEIHQLFNNVTQNQQFVLARPEAGYFTSLKKLYPDSFEITGYFEDEKLVAFYSAFITGSDYEIYYIGFDYASNEKYQLYFNMLFSGLEQAILLKKTTLKLGRTSFDAKASLGAKPQKLPYIVKTPYIPHFVLRRFINYFSALEDKHWKLRNPLKANAGNS